jgi:hypothetical protein
MGALAKPAFQPVPQWVDALVLETQWLNTVHHTDTDSIMFKGWSAKLLGWLCKNSLFLGLSAVGYFTLVEASVAVLGPTQSLPKLAWIKPDQICDARDNTPQQQAPKGHNYQQIARPQQDTTR